jgi:hypothetical protein
MDEGIKVHHLALNLLQVLCGMGCDRGSRIHVPDQSRKRSVDGFERTLSHVVNPRSRALLLQNVPRFLLVRRSSSILTGGLRADELRLRNDLIVRGKSRKDLP